MGPTNRWLWVTTFIAIACSVLAIAEVVRLDRRLRHMVISDMVVVPARMGAMRSSAGIGPSENGQEMVLWLGRMDSNAQTRLAVDKDGGQTLGFFDKRGALRLSIGIDATGEAQIRFVDSKGNARVVTPDKL